MCSATKPRRGRSRRGGRGSGNGGKDATPVSESATFEASNQDVPPPTEVEKMNSWSVAALKSLGHFPTPRPEGAPLWQTMTAESIKDQGPRWWSPPDRPYGPVPLPEEIVRLQKKADRKPTPREKKDLKTFEQFRLIRKSPGQEHLPQLLCWEEAFKFTREDSQKSLIEEAVAVQGELSEDTGTSSSQAPEDKQEQQQKKTPSSAKPAVACWDHDQGLWGYAR